MREENFILACLHPPPRSPTGEAVCRSSGKYQAWRLPVVHPEYSAAALGRGCNGDYIWRLKVLLKTSEDKFNMKTKEKKAEKGAALLLTTEEETYYVSKIQECSQRSSEAI
ncbi:hypothetical protein TNCV_4418781 [Trichonephila clavipes]|nr:hypothetical protein TNCV_4418781 [Trichonephila clavipes]